MTEKEYRAHPAISRSELWWMRESPEKFKWHREHPEEPTPSLVFGQLFHAMLLQPETVGELFAVALNVDRRTKEGKQAFAEFQDAAKGKTIVSFDMVETATEMCKAVEANPFARKLLAGEKEIPFFWKDELTGEQCKCRVDCLTEIAGKTIIVDVKTADSAETEAFTRSAIRYGYDFQAAMYSEGVTANTGKKPLFVFIVVEKTPPYSINILQADEFLVRRGNDLFREYIGIYHDCCESGNWYGYLGKFNQINNLGLPPFLAKAVE